MKFFKTVKKGYYNTREDASYDAYWQQFFTDRSASTIWCMTWVKRLGKASNKNYSIVTIGLCDK